MRTLVIILALLATAKVATVEWLRHTASDDLIVSAYKARALEACAREARRKALGVVAPWSADTAVTLEIGDRRSHVYLWQVDDPAWSERFRAPYLHLIASGSDSRGGQVQCTYNVLAGSAIASHL